MATASAYTKVAQELYISYFGRPADSIGLLNMSAALAAAGAPTTTSGLDAAYASNASVRALMDSFGKSGESTVLYGTASPGSSTARFVTEVFHYLFGRAPAQSGLAFWTNAIDSGSLTLAAAAHSILTGAIVANGADAALIDKKVIFANHFTTALDTDTEVSAYRGAVAAQIGRDLLASVTAATDPGTSQTAVPATLAQLGKSIVLTTGADNLAGVSGPNLFVANIAGNSNTLQSGDRISAGDGVDTLRANVGVFQASALTPETQGVENVIVRADASISTTAPIEINAASMKGVTRWESKHSHGDLVIDHVGIANSQLPENVTVAMAGTDAGNVDFGVYFDTAALRALNPTVGGQTLRLQLMDTRSAEAGDAPLKGNPYDGFVFTFNGKPVQVRSPAIDQAQTYPELLAAIRAQVAVTPGLEKLVVSLGGPFEAYDTQYGHLQSGREILITNPGTGSMTTDDTSGWLSSLIPNDTMHKAMPIGPVAAGRALITSTVVLDGVGRGATGGDLVIGAKATSTVTQPGVEAFNITVENTSRLQTINSTYNRLETVNLVNGTSKGDVSVRGATDTADQPLPGLVGERTGSQHGDTYGFHDVRQVNAGAMKGKVDIEAIVSDLALAKYIDQPGSQTGARGESVDFIYLGGNNDDVVMLDITSNMAAKRGDRAAGLEDFRFKMGGGTGDDQLTLRILPSVQGNNSWMVNQDLNNNITLSGGNGNDTLRKPGAGDAVLDGGDGNDAIYAENSGLQEVLSFVAGQMNVAASTTYLGAQWVFNTADQMGLLAPAREFGALKSDALDTYKLAGTKVNVSFQGIGSSVTVGTTLSMTMPTDKDINEAITHAINDDPVLNQLLHVNDGPGSALIVHALIDGAMSPADLNISLQALDPASLTDAQVSAWAAAYGLTGGAVSTDSVFNVIQTSLATFNANGDYASAMAVDHGAVHSITGVNSSAASDNLILPGMGNDVVVLGTALGARKAVSSNDTVVFEGNFGNDTLVHFNPAGAGIDHLDFTALGGKTLTADLAVNKSITVVAAGTSNDTLAKISALFNAYNAETMTHVVALVDGTGNAAMIFSIEDVAGADNGKATMQGRIDLGTVNWHSALTQANFVDATSIGFSQAEGAAGVVATPVQLVGMTLPESGLAGA